MLHKLSRLKYPSCLFQYLAGCLVGASLDDVEEEEEEAEETQEQVLTGPKPGCYQVVGTLKDPEAKKPDFVKEIFQVRTYLILMFNFAYHSSNYKLFSVIKNEYLNMLYV